VVSALVVNVCQCHTAGHSDHSMYLMSAADYDSQPRADGIYNNV